MSLRRRSSRVRVVEPPTPVNPITNRPYGEKVPERDEATEAAIAEGQRALATAYGPGEHLRELLAADGYKVDDAQPRAGYDPRRSAWAGARG